MNGATEATAAARPGVSGEWVMRGVLLLLGLAVMLGGVKYGVMRDGHVGPGFMPFAAGLVMVLAGLWEAVTAWRRDRVSSADAANENVLVDEADVFGRTGRERTRAVVTVFAVLLAATVLAHVIGLLLALTLMVVVLLGWVERKKWWVALVGGALAFLFGYLVFGVLLDVPLPTGMLGIV